MQFQMMQMMMQMQFQMMQMMVQVQLQVQLSFSSLQLQLRAASPTGSSKKAWVQRECMHRSTACIELPNSRTGARAAG